MVNFFYSGYTWKTDDFDFMLERDDSNPHGCQKNRGLCGQCFHLLLSKSGNAMSKECFQHISISKCCQQVYHFA